MSVIFTRSIFIFFSNFDFFSSKFPTFCLWLSQVQLFKQKVSLFSSRFSQAIYRLLLEQFSLNSYLAQVISQTTLNHSLEPVKTIKINPSVSTVTVWHTQALRDKFYALDFAWKPGVLHNTGACRKYAVNKVIYNYREGGNVHLELLTGRNV